EGHAVRDAPLGALPAQRRDRRPVADDEKMEIVPSAVLGDEIDDAVEAVPFANEAGEPQDNAIAEAEAVADDGAVGGARKELLADAVLDHVYARIRDAGLAHEASQHLGDRQNAVSGAPLHALHPCGKARVAQAAEA